MEEVRRRARARRLNRRLKAAGVGGGTGTGRGGRSGIGGESGRGPHPGRAATVGSGTGRAGGAGRFGGVGARRVVGWAGRHRLVAGVVAVLLLWLAAGLVEVTEAYFEGHAAQAELDSARDSLSGGGLTSGTAVGPLDSGGAELDRAAGKINGFLALPWREIPYLGRQVRAVGSLAVTGSRVARVTAGAVVQVKGVLSHHPVGEARVEELRELDVIAGGAESQLRSIMVIPASGLIGPVRSRRDELASQLDKGLSALDKARAAAGQVATLLQGPSQYLLLVANNGEMRAGSGAFLTAGLLNGSDGTLSVTSLVSTAYLQLPVGEVPISGDLAARWGWLAPDVEWRNLGTTPDFPVTAALAARMWQAYSGQAVQGVLAIDIPTFQLVLSVTGPVTIGGQVFDAGNVEQYLIHDQYADASFDPAQDAPRTALLDQLAKSALHILESGQVSLSRVSGLGPVVGGRHLMVWSSSPAQEQAWETAGVAGTVGTDDLELSVINRGGNKLDQYLRTSAVMTAAGGPGGATDVNVAVTVRNVTPAGQAAFIAGPNPDLAQVPYGTYTGLVSLDIPASARILGVTGAKALAAAGPDGPTTSVYAAAVSIPRGSSETLTYRFVLPSGVRSLRIDPSARVPATQWSFGGRSFEDSGATTVSW